MANNKIIENEELREQIKGAGIGTSATRAEIIKKLEKIKYISINAKTQIISPTEKGEAIYDIVKGTMEDLLNPKLTASWEKGLEMVGVGYRFNLKGKKIRNICWFFSSSCRRNTR